ncbi:MAG: hypothetical protein JW384_03764 [Nitrosomonadaceae bacterium]|nr:hypothetical protein [Nitrosomonadaceae bacterium]
MIPKPPYTISFNWATILFVSFFLAYGYYGARTPGYGELMANLGAFILQIGLLVLILVVFGLLAWKASDRFQDRIEIHKTDILVFCSYLTILLALSFEQLQFSLFSDEISYSATSHGQSMYVALALGRLLDAVGDFQFKFLVQVVSLTLLISLMSVLVLSRRLTWKHRIILCSLLLLSSRLLISFLGGNHSPHPPLQLIPPFVFGSLLGIRDGAFKLSYFVLYVIYLHCLFRMLCRAFPFALSYLLALAIGTLPLLLRLGTIVEHSLWASICFTLVLAEIITATKLNYIRLISCIAIATLMRQPSFLAIFPVLMLMVAEELQSKDKGGWVARTLCTLSPVLLFMPFLGESLIRGTPSTEALRESSAITRVLSAFDSDIIWTSIANAIPYWWIALIPFSIIPLSRTMLSRNIILFCFGVLALCVYYSIHPSLWGFAKYQAEYAVPFAISGLLLLALKLSASYYSRYILPGLLAVLIALNIAALSYFPQEIDAIWRPTETVTDASQGRELTERHLIAVPYNYHEAYDAIKRGNLTQGTYSIGATYGVFSEIMNGYSVRAILISRDIYLKQESDRLKVLMDGWDVDAIERDPRIQVVLVGSVPFSDKQKLVVQFKARNWVIVGEYRNMRYGSTVVALRRNPSVSGCVRACHAVAA